jgi:hypothetical protein
VARRTDLPRSQQQPHVLIFLAAALNSCGGSSFAIDRSGGDVRYVPRATYGDEPP